MLNSDTSGRGGSGGAGFSLGHGATSDTGSDGQHNIESINPMIRKPKDFFCVINDLKAQQAAKLDFQNDNQIISLSK